MEVLQELLPVFARCVKDCSRYHLLLSAGRPLCLSYLTGPDPCPDRRRTHDAKSMAGRFFRVGGLASLGRRTANFPLPSSSSLSALRLFSSANNRNDVDSGTARAPISQDVVTGTLLSRFHDVAPDRPLTTAAYGRHSFHIYGYLSFTFSLSADA